MEFKFSCKWFEIALSGDPGLVQAQLEQYEPFIMTVMKRIEQEVADSRERPVQHAPQEPARQREEDERRPHRNRHDRGGRHEKRNHYPGLRPVKPNPPRPGAEQAGPGQAPSRSPAPEGQGRESSAEKPKPPSPQGQQVKEQPSPPSSPEFQKRRRAPRIKEDELKQVVEEKKPRTHHDRVMVFGYYMEEQGNGSDFQVEEIKKCYREIGQDPGSNIEKVMNHATRSGFISRFDVSKNARFKLTNKGRRYVEDGLKLS